jgi:hypothetical protein
MAKGIHHFTSAVHASYVDAVERFREMDLMSSDLDEVSKRSLQLAKQSGRGFSIQDAKQWFGNVSDHGIRMRLNGLVQLGALVSEGQTRGKKYRYADPIERMTRNLEGEHGEGEGRIL